MNIDQIITSAVAGLQLGEHFSFDALTVAVELQRHRKIRVAELPEISDCNGLCALLLFGDEGDLILHAHTDSALHSQQFILHEFAHIILGHCDIAARSGDDLFPDTLFPDLPSSLRARALARSDVDTEEEIIAESLADRLAGGIRGSAYADTTYTEIFG